MIKTLCIFLLALPLIAPAPVPAVSYAARLAVMTSAPTVQACSYETASAKLSAQIVDPIGIPFGLVQAWSCSGDGAAVANELQQRAAEMSAAAAAYRQAHPIAR